MEGPAQTRAQERSLVSKALRTARSSEVLGVWFLRVITVLWESFSLGAALLGKGSAGKGGSSVRVASLRRLTGSFWHLFLVPAESLGFCVASSL